MPRAPAGPVNNSQNPKIIGAQGPKINKMDPQGPPKKANIPGRKSGSIRGHRDTIPGHPDTDSSFWFPNPGHFLDIWGNCYIWGPHGPPEFLRRATLPYDTRRIHLKPSQVSKPGYFAKSDQGFFVPLRENFAVGGMKCEIGTCLLWQDHHWSCRTTTGP